MTAGYSSAVEQALALSRAPALLSAVRSRPLPADLPILFRLAAGDGDLLGQLAGSTGEPERALSDAAVFYLQQVLFAPGSDSYRVLGVEASAPDEQIKEHYRLLVRWLHPDRNSDEWDAIYADRVNRAWQDLRSAEKRRDYDQRLQRSGPIDAAGTELSGSRAGASSLAERRSGEFRAHAVIPDARAVLSSRTVRNLPLLVVGGLGSVAALALAVVWYLDQAEWAYARSGTPASAVPLVTPDVAAQVPELMSARTTEPLQAEAIESVEPVEPDRTPAAPIAPVPVPAAALRPPAAVAPTQQVVMAEPVRSPAGESQSSSMRATRDEPATPTAITVESSAPSVSAPVAPVGSDVVAIATPPPAKTANEGVERDPSVAAQAQARAVLDRFQKAYASGDIDTFMALFTRDARQNRGGRDAIAKDYLKLFGTTDSRSMQLHQPLWMPDGEGGSMTANYQVVLLSRGSVRPRTVSGAIRFDLQPEDGRLRIARLLHE